MEEIQTAVDGAEKQMQALGDPMDMFEHAYAEMPSYVKEQKAKYDKHGRKNWIKLH